MTGPGAQSHFRPYSLCPEALLTALDVVPWTARLRGAKMIAGAAVFYYVLRLIGFQKLFENDLRGSGRFCRSSARSTVWSTRSPST